MRPVDTISLTEWGDYLEEITEQDDLRLVEENGRFCLLHSGEIKRHKGCKKLNFDQIIGITLDRFENAVVVTDLDREHIIAGLKHLVAMRHEKYKKMNWIRRFLSGKRTQRKLNREEKSICQLTAMIHLGHTCTKQLMDGCEHHVYDDLDPIVLETMVTTLMKDKSIARDPTNYSTLNTIAEHAAHKYVDAKNLHAAFRVRLALTNVFYPDQKFLDLKDDETKHFDRLDSGAIKNGSIQVKKMQIAEEKNREVIRISFKVSPSERKRLTKLFKRLSSRPNVLKRFLTKRESEPIISAGKMVPHVYHAKKEDGTYSASKGFKLGQDRELKYLDEDTEIKVRFGSTHFVYTQRNQIEIFISAKDQTKLDEHQIEKTFTLLSSLGLGGALMPQKNDDDERMKIFHLLRFHFPKEARSFEFDSRFFEMSSSKLRHEIGKKVPKMKEVFKKYLDDQPELMYKQEIHPGKEVWAIRDKAKELQEAGAVGLMSGTRTYACAAKMLRYGAMSSQDRFQNGWIVRGASSTADLRSGGGDQIFTRMITKKDIKDKTSIHHFPISGKVQLIYDLKVLERGGYGYSGDHFGSKLGSSYKFRNDFITLVNKLNKGSYFTNEFMLKNRSPPQYINGMVVQTTEAKRELIEALRNEELVEEWGGKEYIKGRDVLLDDFVHVGNAFTEKMWGVEE